MRCRSRIRLLSYLELLRPSYFNFPPFWEWYNWKKSCSWQLSSLDWVGTLIWKSYHFLITSYQPAILLDKIDEMYFWIKWQRFTSRLFKNDSPYYSYERLTLLWIACIYYGKYINGKMTRYYFLCKIRWVFPLNSVRPKSEIWPKLSNSAIFGL